MTNPVRRSMILGADPLGRPNARLVTALARGGALGVLVLDPDPQVAARDLAFVTGRTDQAFAVQPTPRDLDRAGAASSLPDAVAAVLVDADDLERLTPDQVIAWRGAAGDRDLIAVVRDRDAATRAVQAGATGLIASGCEAGGRVGDVEAFVLLQQVLAGDPGVPVWVRGGIGPHSAAGVVAAGATGVVLDVQLALVREAGVPDALHAAIAAMDGSETRVLGGHRVYTRPDLAVARLEPTEDVATIAARLGADLDRDLVPVGQDAALAAALGQRHLTAGGVVQAVATAVDVHLDTATRVRPLAPGAGVAAAHGVRYPVAQGPMTRVSDRAPFAAAVAEGGGLPFLALALMPGAEVRTLLDETAELLGDRPWGVGILGFVPPELREEQLAVITDCRPPLAIIAGGRPSQAAPLEAAGIATYLHVPSPGLLDRFVKDGARRFVFEGRECGGHVGPRASLGLWDAQVERLLQVEDPENLHVLFAGGIHDATSAAAIAAVGAPLAARGAHLGVLMGTAYLFTQEAVAGGAILPTFQEQAVACEQTVLLETAPGHATRCVDSSYVQAFAARKAELEAVGAEPAAMWGELEELNLGRLRIASKGVVRRPGRPDLETVDVAEQQAEGMYMIGQVATLRDGVTTIASLHDEVTVGATARLAGLTASPRVHLADRPGAPVPARLDVAVVGMAAMFPGAVTADDFWTAIVRGANAITEVPPERWDAARYYDPHATTSGGRTTPSKWGGFLPGIGFDPLAYGIPPASLGSIEPVQLLSLEVAARALADAGYEQRPFDRSRASVVFGAENGNDLSGAYGFRSLYPQLLGELPPELDAFLPAYDEDSFPGVLTNVIAGRIANRLDLGGVNYTVDAACAASLAALDTACKELITGHSDLVLCGGADLHNGINDYLLFASVHALSPTGQCRTFDEHADGIALGEGIACVVLKRLADAERDGDRVYAVIDAVAGSSDGRHLGLTAPRKEGQQRALRRAYAQAGHAPAEVGLVEAHGTGTVVGDRTELATLTEVFAEDGAGPGACVLGSVKSQIGHTKCAAGLAGLIKVARAIHHGVLPPTLNITTPNSYHDRSTNPFRFNDAARPWVGPDRRAGVSAFGFGGANFHAVLSAPTHAEPVAHGVEGWPAELFLFRAPDADAAREQVVRLLETVEAVVAVDPTGVRHRLRDLAATTSRGGRGAVQAAVVATDLADLATKLRAAAAGTPLADGVFLATGGTGETSTTGPADPDAEVGSAAGTGPGSPGRVAFLYPGQGSQRVDMLAELFVTFPALRPVLERGERWADLLYPATAFTREERAAQKEAVTDTRVAQPLLGIAGLALTELWRSVGVTPDAAAGHSYGELLALAAAGALDPDELLELSAARGEAIVGAAPDDPGAMAAVRATVDEVRAVVGDHDQVVVANHNSPRQVVISGPTDAVDRAVEALLEAGHATTRLSVACAFHSPVIAAAVPQFASRLDDARVGQPAFAVWANSTAAPYPNDPAAIRAQLAGQIAAPVGFVAQIEAMYASGIRVFVETGPGRVLTRCVGEILGDRPHLAVASDVAGEHGVMRFLLAVGALAVAGVPVRPDALFRERARTLRLGDLPVPAPSWTIDGHLVRGADGSVVRGGLRPMTEVPATVTGAPGASGAPTERDGTVLEYLRGIRELVAAEREVMLHFLGAPATAIGAPTRPVLDVAATDGPLAPSTPLVAGVLGSGHAAAVTGAPAPRHGADLLAVVMQIVADRTGYPPDMLDPDLDLEADLSIDSIKRIEILGELAEQVGLPGATAGEVDESVIEELAQIKTLRGIVNWIDGRGEADPAPAAAAVEAPDTPAPELTEGKTSTRPVPARARRAHVVEDRTGPLVTVPTSECPGRLGSVLVVAPGDAPLAWALDDELRAAGVTVRLTDADPASEAAQAELVTTDTFVYVAGPEADAREAFAWLRPVALAGIGRIAVVVDRTVTPPGSGLTGLTRTLARERPDAFVRAIRSDGAPAGAVVAELLDGPGPVAVSLGRDGTRTIPVVHPADPRDTDTEAVGMPGLDGDAVVVLTGGARGITARVARALASSGCRIELLGRTPEPGPAPAADPELEAATDRVALRRLLIARGGHPTPAEIERACSTILADREIRTTLDAVRSCGAAVGYHAVDVRDRASLAATLTAIEAAHGPISLVVHGAGVLDDRLIRDKSAEGFDAVFATKVDAARTILDTVSPTARVVLFGSVSGVFGNRGQVDYAAANDALDELALAASAAAGHRRVIAVDWGPWGGTGMVDDALEREYERRGIGLIEPEDGVRALLDELRDPDPAAPAQVVVLRADPAAFGFVSPAEIDLDAAAVPDGHVVAGPGPARPDPVGV